MRMELTVAFSLLKSWISFNSIAVIPPRKNMMIRGLDAGWVLLLSPKRPNPERSNPLKDPSILSRSWNAADLSAWNM